MAAVTLGRVEQFDGMNDDWLQYVERLKHFLAANGIDADKKRAVLLTVVGAATYKTLRRSRERRRMRSSLQPWRSTSSLLPRKL